MALNKKRRAFVDDYIITGNQTESYLKVYKGTSEKTAAANASRLMNDPDVIDYLDKKMKELDDELVADQKEVLKYLTSVLRGEQTEEVLRGVGKGAQRIDSMDVSAKDRIKAAELIGKRYGLFSDRIDLAGDVSITFVEDVPFDDD